MGNTAPPQAKKNKAHTLSKLAEERDTTVRNVIVSAIEQTGSILAAAVLLDVTPGAIRYHLRKRHLRTQKRTELVEEQS